MWERRGSKNIKIQISNSDYKTRCNTQLDKSLTGKIRRTSEAHQRKAQQYLAHMFTVSGRI